MSADQRAADLAALKAANPRKPLADLEVYLDARADYVTAQANIAEHGPLVFHPRTGSPIDNPYLKIRNSSVVLMRGLKLKTDALWQ